jgi:hypothetical protein
MEAHTGFDNRLEPNEATDNKIPSQPPLIDANSNIPVHSDQQVTEINPLNQPQNPLKSPLPSPCEESPPSPALVLSLRVRREEATAYQRADPRPFMPRGFQAIQVQHELLCITVMPPMRTSPL